MTALRAFLLAGVVAGAAVAGSAALSKQYADWPSTAVQWLMTRDDQRAWRDVRTDEQARAFIDLFWARRDPTPGTPLNEYRNEFEARVRYCDAHFGTKRRAGSLTDRGRVFILLGSPKNLLDQTKDTTGGATSVGVFTAGGSSAGSTGGGPAEIGSPGSSLAARTLAAKNTFEYERPFALGLSGPVVFIQNPTTLEFAIDPQQSNVMGALADAVKRAIVSPELKQVPEWAESGLRQAPVAARESLPDTETVAGPSSVTTRKTIVQPPAPTAVAGAAGAHDLWLLGNVRVIRAGEDENPFAHLTGKWAFKKNEDLGFAFEYCAVSLSSPRPSLTMSITMSGKVKGEPVSVSTPEDDVLAEPLAKLPGCYLVRGAIPLESLEPGSYGFFVNVKDAAGKTVTLEKGFTVE